MYVCTDQSKIRSKRTQNEMVLGVYQSAQDKIGPIKDRAVVRDSKVYINTSRTEFNIIQHSQGPNFVHSYSENKKITSTILSNLVQSSTTEKTIFMR